MAWETSDFSNLKINDIIYSHIHNPKKVLNFYDGHERKSSYSVKEIHDEVQIKKQILKSSLQANELVFLSWQFDFGFVTLFLALLEIEVVPVPLLSDQNIANEKFIPYLIECKKKTGISKIISPEKYKENLVANGFEIVILKKEKDFLNSKNNPQVPRLIHSLGKQKNSYIHLGLTEFGFLPEVFIFSHQSILKSILKIKSELHLSEDQKVLNSFSDRDDFFIFASLLLPLIIGMESHYFSFKSSLVNTYKWLEKSSDLQAELWFAGADFYVRLLDFKEGHLRTDISLQNIKHCLCSPQGLDPDLADHVNYEFKKIGLSEEAFKVFYSPMVNHFISSFTRNKVNIEKWHNKKISSLGVAVKGNFYRVVDENNYILGEDQEGFIAIKSNTFAPVIYNFETKAEQFLDEQTWFRTNDIGFMHGGELYRTGGDESKILFQNCFWTKSALRDKAQKICSSIKEVKDIQVQSLRGKKGQEEIYLIIVMGFSFKWFSLFLKRKLVYKLVEKLKIKKEHIIFVSYKEIPLTLDGRLKPLSFKQLIVDHLSLKG